MQLTVFRKGQPITFETVLSGKDALSILRNHESDFARSLLTQYDNKGSLSNPQWNWVYFLAEEMQQKKRAQEEINRQVEAVVQDENQMDGIFALFKKGGEKLQYPKIRLMTNEGKIYRLHVLGKKSRYEGQISINEETNGNYIGRITTDGLVFPAFGVILANHGNLLDKLKELSNDPENVAKEFARLTGRCCFCNDTLTDERSTKAGWGPVCAKNYKLPWGK